MEITPEMNSGSSSAKRTRAKPKVTVKSAAPVAPAAVKKPRAPRKTLTTKTAAEASVAGAAAEPISEDVGSMIATAAYFLAAARNFMPGHELDDWLAAERSIYAKLHS